MEEQPWGNALHRSKVGSRQVAFFKINCRFGCHPSFFVTSASPNKDIKRVSLMRNPPPSPVVLDLDAVYKTVHLDFLALEACGRGFKTALCSSP